MVSDAPPTYTTPAAPPGSGPTGPTTGAHTWPSTSPAIVTPSASSPASPRSSSAEFPLPLHARQLRNPKCPLYRPVALRQTEPMRRAPLTPPSSSNNSFDSLRGMESPRMLSRQSTGESTLSMEPGKPPRTEWQDGVALGTVQGPPTRDHWKPDASATICQAASCDTVFSLFERRHHCRHCGHIFCHEHTPYTVPLDHYARFHPQGQQSRACDACWTDFKRWTIARSSRSSSQNSQQEGPNTPVMGIAAQGLQPRPRGTIGTGAEEDLSKSESVVGSVPRDWNWSTF